ncbi:hypothetical protein GA0115254_124623 [Streptomyces sp. Ncost-T10-10d]|nr:hypothetical protein GA0115254_124623 [Streptomyces sp. Ncost-T10-10d]
MRDGRGTPGPVHHMDGSAAWAEERDAAVAHELLPQLDPPPQLEPLLLEQLEPLDPP